ncbi:hydroxyethylthiazole kinase [uncultured Roseovarius sp.]|uniref:hydroxyethylthiazole kinase n=1 Tax=uncultured Roseovarius sp. TaxID=293344 RepID=UPI0025F3B8AC|nr:hydroxyethylthiazole kinase [uncultured Roseovarius sp.]
MEKIGTYLEGMRATPPLVQNITNYVAMNVMANVMLAAGASPAMVHAREEAAEFAGIASALTVNIGTLDPEWVAAMEEAAQVMNEAGKPWVLDPVAVFATGFRRAAVERLVALKPTVIRGNASEIMAIAGVQASGQGADAGDAVEAAEEAARGLAKATGGVVAVTGEVDFVTDGARAYRVENGHAVMPKVTALGCSLTGVVGAFASGQPALEGTVAALAYYGLAGERAGARTDGPGSFAVAFLDELHGMTPEGLSAGARVRAA